MPVPRAVSVGIPETDRRTPLAVVRVAAGPLTVALGVALPRSGRFAVRPPPSTLGKPAVAGPPGLRGEVERLAVAAVRHDPAAARHLIEHRSRRYAAADTGSPAAL